MTLYKEIGTNPSLYIRAEWWRDEITIESISIKQGRTFIDITDLAHDHLHPLYDMVEGLDWSEEIAEARMEVVNY